MMGRRSALMFTGAAARIAQEAALAEALRLDLPILDLSGLAAGPSERALEALAPAC